MVTSGMCKLPTLKKNYEFQRVYGRGRYASSRTLVVYVLANRSGTRRMGITTSRKVGKSVVRNRIRRLIRENLRGMMGSLPLGRDIVVVARKADESAGFESVGQELRLLFARLGLMDKTAAKERENARLLRDADLEGEREH
jgi:ribonuclease P protein component